MISHSQSISKASETTGTWIIEISLVLSVYLYCIFQDYQSLILSMLLKVLFTSSPPQLLQPSLTLRLKTAGKPAPPGCGVTVAAKHDSLW